MDVVLGLAFSGDELVWVWIVGAVERIIIVRQSDEDQLGKVLRKSWKKERTIDQRWYFDYTAIC